MTTFRELALHLGLSPATVSRALNGFPEVGEKTRARVLEAAGRLNYKPNSNAKRLATGKSGMVGMIFRSSRNLLVDPHFVDFLAGLSTAWPTGTSISSSTRRRAGELLAHYKRFVASGSVDGMIVSAPEVDDERITTLSERELSVRRAWPHRRRRAATRISTSTMMEPCRGDGPPLRSRAQAHRDAQRAAGAGLCHAARGGVPASDRASAAFMVPERFVAHDEMSEEQRLSAARRAAGGAAAACPHGVHLLVEPSGAWRDPRGGGARDCRCAADISIIAHDDVLPHLRSEHFTPALTVTRSPIRDAGTALAEMIVLRIGGAEPKALQRSCRPT